MSTAACVGFSVSFDFLRSVAELFVAASRVSMTVKDSDTRSHDDGL
ncbi:MAG: hypothetical protein ACI9C1_002099 [Candidatus Aldehydirespiratoraceae bacterium]